MSEIPLANARGGLLPQDITAQFCDPSVAKVFDFDGTLFNTNDIQRRSSDDTFRKLGLAINITPEFAASFRGKSDEEIYALILGEDQHELIRTATDTRSRLLVELAEELDDPSSLLLSGVSDAVRMLRHTGQTAGVASASPDAFVHEFMRKTVVDGTAIDDVFPTYRVSGATSIKAAAARGYTSALPKPSPFSIMCAARGMNEPDPRSILYVGDSHVDVRSIVSFPGAIGGLIVSSKHEQLRAGVDSPNILFTGALSDIWAAQPELVLGAVVVTQSAEQIGNN